MNLTRRLGVLLASIFALLAVVAAQASAATVANDNGVIRWTGTDEADEVRFEYEQGRILVLSQTGQPQTPGAGCPPSDDNAQGVAYCQAPPGTHIVLDFK